MANPIIPGIPQTEQDLLYSKLNAYNQGRASYKEVGAYLVVLPRPEHPQYTLWVYSPLPGRQSIKNNTWRASNPCMEISLPNPTFCMLSPGVSCCSAC